MSADQNDMGLGVFVKTPGLTPAKTRLGKTIGQERAEEFYLLSIACIRENLNHLQNINDSLNIYWSVVEEDDVSKSFWNDHEIIFQCEGSLGKKLAHIDKELSRRHGQSIFMGADSPQIDEATFDRFFQLCLRVQHDHKKWCIMAPTLDGGFWLMAKNAVLPESEWEKVAYSASSTAQELIQVLQENQFYVETFLPEQSDVDTIEDLKFVIETMEVSPRGAKKNLKDWAQNLLSSDARV